MANVFLLIFIILNFYFKNKFLSLHTVYYAYRQLVSDVLVDLERMIVTDDWLHSSAAAPPNGVDGRDEKGRTK